MSRQARLEKVALLSASAVLVLAIWFWSGQIGDVLETLALAYGE